jgi:hypothetical protein
MIRGSASIRLFGVQSLGFGVDKMIRGSEFRVWSRQDYSGRTPSPSGILMTEDRASDSWMRNPFTFLLGLPSLSTLDRVNDILTRRGDGGLRVRLDMAGRGCGVEGVWGLEKVEGHVRDVHPHVSAVSGHSTLHSRPCS